MHNLSVKNFEYYKKKKVYWQQFTNDELTDNDIDEIHYNVMAFTKCLIELNKELNEQDKSKIYNRGFTAERGKNER